MIRTLRFGIPSLDELIGKNARRPGDNGIFLSSAGTASGGGTVTSSICILGPEGTGKSVFGLHLASRYKADYVESSFVPKVLYVSTDLTHSMAEGMWENFALNLPNARQIPFSRTESEAARPFNGTDGGPKQSESARWLQVNLRPYSPENLSDFLSDIEERSPSVAEVGFVDLASFTAGDDWGFINRILAVMETPRAGQPAHLMVVDAVEGFQTLVGDQDAFGEPSSRRARIAQVMRSAVGKCHIVLVVEQQEDTERLPEEFVTDAVIRLRGVQVKNYGRRTVEVEKVRGQWHVRGQHPFVIRSGKGSTTFRQENIDDPEVLLPALPPTEGEPERQHRRPKAYQSYVHVFHSLHHLSRSVMEFKGPAQLREEKGWPESTVGPGSGECQRYAAFGVPYLDEMLAGTAETVEREKDYDTRGLPCGTITALIGDSGTQKSQLGTAFLNRCFTSYQHHLHSICRELLDGREGARPMLSTVLVNCLIEKATASERGSNGKTKFFEFGQKNEGLRHWLREHGREETLSSTLKLLDQKRTWTKFVDRLQRDFLDTAPALDFPQMNGHARAALTELGGWLLNRSCGSPAGVAVLLTMRDANNVKLAKESFAPWSANLNDLEESFPGYRKQLERHIESHTICRRLELHDLPAPILFHILQQTIEEAQRLSSHGQRPPKLSHRRTLPVRLVVDDFSTFRDTYPEVREDPLLLPFLLFYLGREGITTLIIDTQTGKPDMPISERFESELRALVQQCLYTWRFPFFGENRVAITAIPPISSHSLGVVRELRWASSAENAPPVVDPHFELYMGLEEGQPQPIPLEVRLFAETEAFRQYIEQENLLYRELFTPAIMDQQSGRREVIISEAPSEHDSLRDFCYLQSDTRLNHTLVFQVDEFWTVRQNMQRRTGAFRPQWSYLNATTTVNGTKNSAVDPFGLFQMTSHENCEQPRSPRHRRRDYFVPIGYELSAEESQFIDRVPFMWDFGFLLCRSRPWQDALDAELSLPKNSRLKMTVRDVWDALPKATPGGSQKTAAGKEAGPMRVRPTSWRAFLEACKKVASDHAFKTSSPVPAFDFSMVTPESFSCLMLEIWASEIYNRADNEETLNRLRQVSGRSWAPPDNLGLIGWLAEDRPLAEIYNRKKIPQLQNYSLELYKAWLLIVDVLNFSELVDSANAFHFKAKDAKLSAVAARHWYKTASTCSEHCSPDDPVVVARLPGHFSIRGDWFLAVAGGSRSWRLADRALDLLNSRRGNINRLQLGLGLPTRDLIAESQYQHLRTKLYAPDKEGMWDNITYADLRRIGAPERARHPEHEDFFWLWRSRLGHYHRHTRIWQKWLNRMVLWWDKLRYDRGDEWKSGLEVYDALTRGDRRSLRMVLDLDSWIKFPEMCDILIAELRQASPEHN